MKEENLFSELFNKNLNPFAKVSFALPKEAFLATMMQFITGVMMDSKLAKSLENWNLKEKTENYNFNFEIFKHNPTEKEFLLEVVKAYSFIDEKGYVYCSHDNLKGFLADISLACLYDRNVLDTILKFEFKNYL